MKSNNFKLILRTLCGVAFAFSGCGKSSTPASPKVATITVTRPNGLIIPAMSGANVVPFTVNGASCAASSYPNKPCVSVTVCAPGTTTCKTINDILLDTGSYGLRVFKSVLQAAPAVSTNPILPTSNTHAYAECVEYGDGSKQWGSVESADVVLGGEPAVTVPIQIIDSTYSGAMSTSCNGAVTTPSSAGFNGILGVGLFKEDCGSHCVNSASNSVYFACDGSSTCTGSKISLVNQVQNPVALLPTDNNGIIIELPNIPTGGIASSAGYMILGIGTASNNVPSGVTAYKADSSYGEFSTTFNGTTYDSFLDTGSNSLSFSGTSQLPDCGSSYPGWFCPSSTLTLSATNTAYTGGIGGVVTFPISNFITLWNTTNTNVYIDIGAGSSGNISGFFDWGLPFFFGRNTYIGIEGKTSGLGTGPYWAY